MRVTNMTSPRTGKKVANQFIIDTKDDYSSNETTYWDSFEGDVVVNGVQAFQSYDVIIAMIGYDQNSKKRVLLDKDWWDYSVTTGKYRNQFLGETKKETQAKIDSGEYKLEMLN